MAADRLLEMELVEQGGDWTGIDAAGLIGTLAGAAQGHLPGASGLATVVLADDALVRSLNHRFRGKDHATNVLSFPLGEEPGPGVLLGDIVLASETLRREALAENKPLAHHFAHLMLHGLLHLLGYDHQSDDEAAIMERLETEILAAVSVPDPYGGAPEAKPLNERSCHEQ